MSTPSKKRRAITLEMKKKIIEGSETKKREELSKEFELPIATIKCLLGRDRKVILNAIDEGTDAKRARFRPVKHENLEKAVLRWFKCARNENVPISGPLIAEKAKELAKELAKHLREALERKPLPLLESDVQLEKKSNELERFEASNGWLDGFKNRHSIVFKENQGEAADIDREALGNWQVDVLHKEISRFSADDVFNADETGLFWQLLPEKTLAFKGERCSSGKKSKERITVLVGSNMTGSEKLPLLVIGKSVKPRSFKNKQPPVDYKANKKAWMTGDLFEAWLKEWDQKLKRNGRKVLLFLDNFSGHSKIQLEQITPCDQGIIQNLKVHYRRLLLRERIAAIDAMVDYKVDLYKALQYLKRSWSNVTAEALANCFRKAGFVKNMEALEQVQAETGINEELDLLWNQLQRMELAKGHLDDYLAADNQLAIGGTHSLAEIAADVYTREMEEPEEEIDTDVVEVEEEPELPQTTTRGAREAIQYLQRYSSNPVMLELCDKLDDLMAEELLKKLKQKGIKDFFPQQF